MHGVYVDRPVATYDSAPGTEAGQYAASGNQRADGQSDSLGALNYKGMPDPKVYGYSTGVVGLRLFVNPDFKGAAARRWDAERYYRDPSYAADPATIRPFRVGMSCAFCHVAPHPLNPPNDPNHPRWENLSSVIGNQYMRVRETFGNQLDPSNYFYHVLDSQLPGTIDTSLIASDNINNANTMNAVFGLGPRVHRALSNPPERLDPESENFPGVWEHEPYPDYPLESLQGNEDAFEGNPRHVPRVLVDGSDSVGSWVALARVYFNIGSYHENWIRLHNTILGFRDQDPFKLHDAAANSVNWHATLLRIDPMTEFFLRSSRPMKLRDAVNLDLNHLPKGATTLAKGHDLGRRVFAKSCIACHSSVQPGDRKEVDSLISVGDDKDHASLRLTESQLWELTRGSGELPPAYHEWAEKAVELPSFWNDNFLSTDRRIPVTMVRTQSARAVGTNAIHDEMWEDFSSRTYKELKSVGDVEYFDPFAQTRKTYQPPGGGPGYYRVPTLIGAWATAPFFHNNSLGDFNNDPSVDGRLKAYDDAIDKLLRPGHRARHDRNSLGKLTVDAPQYSADGGLIWRTSADSYLVIENHQIPGMLFGLTGWRPIWLAILPWVPALASLAIGLLLLFSGLILRRTARWHAYVESLSIPIALVRWGTALLIAFSVVASMVLLLYYRVAIRDWEALLGFRGPWIWLQAWMAVLLVGFVGYLLIQRDLPLIRLQVKKARFAGVVCLFIACFYASLLGRFLSGQGADIRIGPFPKGMPVNLVANLDPASSLSMKLKVVNSLRLYLRQEGVFAGAETGGRHASGSPPLERFEQEVAPVLMQASKCPDLVMDRGHDYVFLDQLTEEEKSALAALIKTF